MVFFTGNAPDRDTRRGGELLVNCSHFLSLHHFHPYSVHFHLYVNFYFLKVLPADYVFLGLSVATDIIGTLHIANKQYVTLTL